MARLKLLVNVSVIDRLESDVQMLRGKVWKVARAAAVLCACNMFSMHQHARE